MAKLEVPTYASNPQPPQETNPLAIGTFHPLVAAADAGAKIGQIESEGGQKLGQMEMQAGEDVDRMGQQYTQQFNKIMDNTYLNQAKTQSGTQYSKAASGILKDMAKDSQSGVVNPNQVRNNLKAASLTAQQSGNDYLSNQNASASAIDSFNSDFNQMQQNMEPQIGSAVRSTEQQSAIKSLNSVVSYHGQQALNTAQGLGQNSANIGPGGILQNQQNGSHPLDYNYGQGAKAIQDASDSGLITPQQAGDAQNKLRFNIYGGSLQLLNKTNPTAVQRTLADNSPDALHLTPSEHQQLQNENNGAMLDLNSQAQQHQEEQSNVSNQQNVLQGNALSQKISQGQAGSADIQAATDAGLIQPGQAANLQDQHNTNVNSILKKTVTMSSISNDIAQGKILGGDYSQKEINDHFNQAVSMISQKPGQPISLTQKAQIAMDYKAPVTNFTKAISETLQEGDPKKTLDAVNAFNAVNDRNPLAVSGIDKPALAKLAMLTDKLSYTNVDPSTVIAQVNRTVNNTDPDELKQRASAFKQEDAFKSNNLGSTISNMYGLNHYLGNDRVDPMLNNTVKNLLSDAYSQTGNADAAQKMVAMQTKGIIGTSQVNSIPGLLRDKNTLMAFPPENVYHRDPSDLRTDLESSVAPILPKGINPQQVLLSSDEITRAQTQQPTADGKPNVSYGVYKIGADGQSEEPIINPKTGQPVRWTPDMNTIDARKQVEAQALQAGKTSPEAKAQALQAVPGTAPESSESAAQLTAQPPQISAQSQWATQSVRQTSTGRSYTSVSEANGDHVLGRYQVPASQLKDWSTDVYGYPISAEKFMKNPDIQDQIAAHHIQQLRNQGMSDDEIQKSWTYPKAHPERVERPINYGSTRGGIRVSRSQMKQYGDNPPSRGRRGRGGYTGAAGVTEIDNGEE